MTTLEDDEISRRLAANEQNAQRLFSIVTDVNFKLMPLMRVSGLWQLASLLCMVGTVGHIVAVAVTNSSVWLAWMLPWIAGGLFSLWRSQRYIKRIRAVMNGLTERIGPGQPEAGYDPLHDKH